MWCAGFFQTTVRIYKSARAKIHHCQQRTNQTPILHAIGKGWFRHIASPFLLDCWQENCRQESSDSYWYYSISVKRMSRSEGMSMSFGMDIPSRKISRRREASLMACFPLFCARSKSGRMPATPYKSRLCGLLKTAFCARFVPNALFQTKNCLFRKGSPIPKK